MYHSMKSHVAFVAGKQVLKNMRYPSIYLFDLWASRTKYSLPGNDISHKSCTFNAITALYDNEVLKDVCNNNNVNRLGTQQ